MSGPEPGTVAVVTSQYGNEVVAIRTGVDNNMGWAYSETLNGQPVRMWSSDRGGLHMLRRLVVIDPEDRDQVEALVKAVTGIPFPFTIRTDDAQAALRALLAPANPPEPGRYGVVEDAIGMEFCRMDPVGTSQWVAVGVTSDDGRPIWVDYADIRVAKVHTLGVSGE